MAKFIIINNHKVYLRGRYALKYHSLQDLETAKVKEADRWIDSNPKMAERIRTMPMLEWLRTGGAIHRTERLQGDK